MRLSQLADHEFTRPTLVLCWLATRGSGESAPSRYGRGPLWRSASPPTSRSGDDSLTPPLPLPVASEATRAFTSRPPARSRFQPQISALLRAEDEQEMEVLCIGTADTKLNELLFLADRLRSTLAADPKVYMTTYLIWSGTILEGSRHILANAQLPLYM